MGVAVVAAAAVVVAEVVEEVAVVAEPEAFHSHMRHAWWNQINWNGEIFFVIDPDECKDCGVCEPECPAEAILPDSDSDAEKWIDLNATQSNIWPNITEKKEQAADAEEFQGVENKFEKFYSDKPGN